MKKILRQKRSIVLAFLLVVAMVTVAGVGMSQNRAKAAGFDTVDGIVWNFNIEDGKAMGLYAPYDIETNSITIPTEVTYKGVTYPVVSVGNKTTMGSSVFLGELMDNTTVSFAKKDGSSSVTTINPYAFYQCDKIVSVDVPDSVTEIGEYAFYRCTEMTSVGDISNVATIGNSAFEGCISLKNVTIDKVTQFGAKMFDKCTSLYLTITNPNMDLSEQNFKPSRLISYANSTTREYYEKNYTDDTNGDNWRSLDGTKKSDGTTYPKSFKVSVKTDADITISSGLYEDYYYGLAGGKVNTLAAAKKDHYDLTGYFSGTEDNAECYYTYDKNNNEMKVKKSTFPADYADSVLELTAKFTPKVYDITYDLNGGNWKSSVSLDLKKTDKEQYTYAVGKTLCTDIERTGYLFKGWYAASDSEQIAKVTDITDTEYGAKDYVAKWMPIHYTIRFDKNTTNAIDMDDQNATYNTTTVLTKNTYTKNGYSFTGWNTKADGSGTAYADEADVTNISFTDGEVITLYAQWKADTNTKYYIEYKYEGLLSEGIDAKEYKMQLSGTSDETVTASVKQFAKDGFTTPQDQTLRIKADGTAVASFVFKRKQYTITTQEKGTSRWDVPQKAYYEQTVTASYRVHPGYSAAGIESDDIKLTDGTDTQVKFKMPANDVTLKANVTLLKYTISYELNGGKNSGNAPTEYTYGDTINLPDASTMSLPGFRFAGWYTKEYFEGEPVTQITPDTIGNKTFWACWDVSSYKVTLDPNGGTIINNNVIEYKYYTHVILPTEDDIIRDGYSFIGWWDGIRFVDEIGQTEYGDKRFTALWRNNAAIQTQLIDTGSVMADTQNAVSLEQGMDAQNTGYYYTTISANAQKVYATLYKNYVFVPSERRFRNTERMTLATTQELTKKDLYDAQMAFVYDHPEIFWVMGFQISIKTTDTGLNYYVFVPDKAYSEEKYNSDAESYYGYLTMAVKDIGIDPNDSTYTKLLKIHNYVTTEFFYDNYGYTLNEQTANDTRSVGRMLSMRKGCCVGYAKLTKVLCDYYKIPCVLVTGSSHMWNEVQVDGKWYGLDTTWDSSAKRGSTVKYDYFLKGADTFSDTNHIVINAMFAKSNGTPVTEYACLLAPAMESQEYQQASSATKNTYKKPVSNAKKVSDTKIVSHVKYKITDHTRKTAAVIGVTSKKVKSITIAKTIKINNKTYKVTAIRKNAFKGCKSLKKVTIKAAGIKSIGRNAFAGIDKKAKFTVPKKQYKAYKKLLSKKAVGYKKSIRIIR